jgi:hypothetical protein
LEEEMLKAEGGGAMAVWTSSGLTEPDKQTIMNKELIKLLFGREFITLGEATAKKTWGRCLLFYYLSCRVWCILDLCQELLV